MKVVKKKQVLDACRQQELKNYRKWGTSWSASFIYKHIVDTCCVKEMNKEEFLMYDYWHYKVKKCVMKYLPEA